MLIKDVNIIYQWLLLENVNVEGFLGNLNFIKSAKFNAHWTSMVDCGIFTLPLEKARALLDKSFTE